jgi:hypothetical protein
VVERIKSCKIELKKIGFSSVNGAASIKIGFFRNALDSDVLSPSVCSINGGCYLNNSQRVESRYMEEVMSMRGENISKEYQKMVWIQDKDGKEYACYIDDLKRIKKKEELTEEEKANCTDLSTVLGDSW